VAFAASEPGTKTRARQLVRIAPEQARPCWAASYASGTESAGTMQEHKRSGIVSHRPSPRPSVCTLIAVQTELGASDIPHFNIEATCRAAPSLQGGIQNPYQSCLQEEKSARAQLEKVWTTHTTQQRTLCVSVEGVGGGSPSYVELLTCLEMYAANRPAVR
jgi:hypothetical protein